MRTVCCGPSSSSRPSSSLGRAHNELAGRDDDHLGADIAVLERLGIHPHRGLLGWRFGLRRRHQGKPTGFSLFRSSADAFTIIRAPDVKASQAPSRDSQADAFLSYTSVRCRMRNVAGGWVAKYCAIALCTTPPSLDISSMCRGLRKAPIAASTGSPRKSRRATSRLRVTVHRWPSPSGPAGETWPGENVDEPSSPSFAHQQGRIPPSPPGSCLLRRLRVPAVR